MGVTVADCLRLPALRQAELAAGAGGLSRSVASVTVLEYPRIDMLSDALLVGNELLISALVSIKDDVEMQCRLLRHLSEMGEAGLILYYTGVFVQEIDDRLISTADDLDFPLILMPRGRMDFRYSESITEVMELVFADQKRERYYTGEMAKRISRLSPQLRTMNSVLRLLSDRLRCTLLLADRSFARKAAAAWPLSNEWDYRLILDTLRENKPAAYSPLVMDCEGRGVRVWDFPVTGKRSQGLHLLALDEEGSQEEDMLRQAAEVVELFLNVWNRDVNLEGTDALVHAILSDQPEEMRRLAGRMGIDIATINTLYVLRLRAADNPALQDAAERLKRYLQEHHKLVVADVYNHGVVAFCDDKLFDEAETDVAGDFVGKMKARGVKCDCAVLERIANTTQARAGYMSVEENMSYAARLWPHKPVFTRGELQFAGECRELLSRGEDAYRRPLGCLDGVPGLADGENLLNILCTYLLDAGSSTQRTGELLHLHRNTVKYHIGKLRTLLAVDLDTMPEAMQVYTAAALWRLMHSEDK